MSVKHFLLSAQASPLLKDSRTVQVFETHAVISRFKAALVQTHVALVGAQPEAGIACAIHSN